VPNQVTRKTEIDEQHLGCGLGVKICGGVSSDMKILKLGKKKENPEVGQIGREP